MKKIKKFVILHPDSEIVKRLHKLREQIQILMSRLIDKAIEKMLYGED